MNFDVLESQVLTRAENDAIFIVIDNAEVFDQEWLASFASKWANCSNGSLLLMLSQKYILLDNTPSFSYSSYELKGLPASEKDAICAILGPELTGRFTRDLLCHCASELCNLPQRLLYIRWLKPSDEIRLKRVTDQLKDEAGSIDDNELQKLFEDKARPLQHFLALVHARTLEFEEDLLAWLWDVTGCGSTYVYAKTRNFLLQERLLSRVGDPESIRYVIHPSLHMKLEKILLRTAGATHLAHIDYYLSEYYRVKYRANRPRIDMVALQEFAHRALRIENVSTVLNVLLDPDALEAIHGQGLGLVLRDILERTECALADLKRINRPKPLASVSQEVMLQIEIAKCLQELSYYELAIAKLDQPEQLSKDIPDCEEKRRMQENIYLIRGISFGSLGDRVESMKVYLSILILMKEGNQVDHLGTEALGYIALMMVFEEPDKAENLGKLAVDLAEKAGNSRILAKNACSLASIFLFSG